MRLWRFPLSLSFALALRVSQLALKKIVHIYTRCAWVSATDFLRVGGAEKVVPADVLAKGGG